MLREMWQTHWRARHGRDWDAADGRAFVHGGPVRPFDQPIPKLLFKRGPRDKNPITRVHVVGGDPTTELKQGDTFQLGEHVFVAMRVIAPTRNKKDPSKPGGVRQ
jgi:hypothetical protein